MVSYRYVIVCDWQLLRSRRPRRACTSESNDAHRKVEHGDREQRWLTPIRHQAGDQERDSRQEP